MKKILVIFLLFTAFCPCVLAEEKVQADYFWPVPSGKVRITNDYGGSPTHAGPKAGYSIDLQVAGRNPDPKFKDIGGDQCFSLGTPVLAIRKGKVIKAYNPPENALKAAYGVMVRIAYEDGYSTTYGHMLPNTLAVKVGDEVEVGQILGLIAATGNVSGKLCSWNAEEITSISDTQHFGPHLHLETRDSKDLKAKQEPMIGKEVYTDLKQGSYTSATQMIDPTGHWGKFAGLVPYVYSGNYVAMASATAHRPRIQSITPSVALAGTTQTFTIKGENLPKSLYLSFLGCGNIQWFKQEATEHQFSCTLAKQPEPRSGFIRLTEKGDIVYNFKINTLLEPDSSILPEIKDVQIKTTRPGEDINFKVTGNNLPTDLRPALKECTEFKYLLATPTQLEFSCRLPRTVKDKNGKRPNGLYTFHTQLISPSIDFSYPVSFTADYQVQVTSMSPVAMVYDKESTIVLTGKNLDLAQAVWVESCKNMQILEKTEKLIKIKCTPYKPQNAMGYLIPEVIIPNVSNNALYDVILKDEQKGEILFQKSIFVSQVALDTPLKLESQNPIPVDEGINSPTANDDIIQYILKAKGNYDDQFLKKVGWKKEINPAGQILYGPDPCNNELKGKAAHANMKKDCLN